MRERYEVITFDMGYTLVDMDSFGEILQRICAEERHQHRIAHARSSRG